MRSDWRVLAWIGLECSPASCLDHRGRRERRISVFLYQRRDRDLDPVAASLSDTENFVSIGPFAFDPTFAKRMLHVLPPYVALSYERGLTRGSAVESTERFLQLLLATFFVLYTPITGAPQLRTLRYLPDAKLWSSGRLGSPSRLGGIGRATAGGIGALITIAMELTETRYQNIEKLYGSALLTTRWPRRQGVAHNDEALRELENPAHIPIVVATASVQIRS